MAVRREASSCGNNQRAVTPPMHSGAAGEQPEGDRGGDEGQQHREAQRADDRDRQGLEHVGAGADAIGERQHAERGGERGHQHRAQAALAGSHQRLLEAQTVGAQMVDEVS